MVELVRRLLLAQKIGRSSRSGTSKIDEMIKTVLHQTGGISLDAFEKLCDYVAKVRPVENESIVKYHFKRKEG